MLACLLKDELEKRDKLIQTLWGRLIESFAGVVWEKLKEHNTNLAST